VTTGKDLARAAQILRKYGRVRMEVDSNLWTVPESEEMWPRSNTFVIYETVYIEGVGLATVPRTLCSEFKMVPLSSIVDSRKELNNWTKEGF